MVEAAGPCVLAPLKTAPAKTVPQKTAPAKTSLLKTALLKTAPVKAARLKFAPPEDCTSEDNTSEDHSAEDCTADDCSSEEAGPSPGLWTVHGCSGPPATRRAGLRHGASFCHAAHSLREAVDSPGILGSIHPFSDGRLGSFPDLRREFKLEYQTINGKCSMISTSLDLARGRAVKGTDRRSAAIGGPGFKPEALQLFLPKWS